MIVQLALYWTLGIILSYVGFTPNTEFFWCIIALFWASQRIIKNEYQDQRKIELLTVMSIAQNNMIKANQLTKEITGVDPKTIKVEVEENV
jgi:hypothetical protein